MLLLVLLVASGCGDADDSVQPVDDTTTTVADDQPTDTVEVEVEDTVTEVGGSEPGESDPEAETEGEFIDLPYWEVFPIDGAVRTTQPDAECERSDPDKVVCDYESAGSLVASHIGRATEVQVGETTTYPSETCGPGGTGPTRWVEDGTGTITAQWGDELHFRVRFTCGHINWVVEGGTGRFADATGRMSGVGAASVIPGALAVNFGTLTVRADLWDDVLPPDAE